MSWSEVDRINIRLKAIWAHYQKDPISLGLYGGDSASMDRALELANIRFEVDGHQRVPYGEFLASLPKGSHLKFAWCNEIEEMEPRYGQGITSCLLVTRPEGSTEAWSPDYSEIEMQVNDLAQFESLQAEVAKIEEMFRKDPALQADQYDESTQSIKPSVMRERLKALRGELSSQLLKRPELKWTLFVRTPVENPDEARKKPNLELFIPTIRSFVEVACRLDEPLFSEARELLASHESQGIPSRFEILISSKNPCYGPLARRLLGAGLSLTAAYGGMGSFMDRDYSELGLQNDYLGVVQNIGKFHKMAVSLAINSEE